MKVIFGCIALAALLLGALFAYDAKADTKFDSSNATSGLRLAHEGTDYEFYSYETEHRGERSQWRPRSEAFIWYHDKQMDEEEINNFCSQQAYDNDAGVSKLTVIKNFDNAPFLCSVIARKFVVFPLAY